MNSRTTDRFRSLFAELPSKVQKQAREAYKHFASNPAHPSLRFKCVHPTQPIYSARISLDHRAVGVQEGGDITWF